jgi:hypothetical protein
MAGQWAFIDDAKVFSPAQKTILPNNTLCDRICTSAKAADFALSHPPETPPTQAGHKSRHRQSDTQYDDFQITFVPQALANVSTMT